MYGINEKQFRKIFDDAGKLITIENLDSFTAIYERKKGNYHQLPQEWCRFIEKYEYLATEKTLSMFLLKFVSMALFFDKSGSVFQQVSGRKTGIKDYKFL